MCFGKGFGGEVARFEGLRKRDATKQRLHVEAMHLEAVLEGAVARAGGQGKRNTTNIDFAPIKCMSTALLNLKTGGSEDARAHFLLFLYSKGLSTCILSRRNRPSDSPVRCREKVTKTDWFL